MADFIPVNSLEIVLRKLLNDRNTLLWDFYTPLAAAPLWVMVQHHPELDGSNLVAPPGQNPGLCKMHHPQGDYIGLYTSAQRAQKAFDLCKMSPHDWAIVSAPGYQLLKLVSQTDAKLFINCGLKECQYGLDPDMVEILLSRPEPVYAKASSDRAMTMTSTEDAEKHLGPLHDFLGRQPHVRAAWIYRPKDKGVVDDNLYELSLVMDDPEDKSLLDQVAVMVKALTPVEMEWQCGVWMADDQSLRTMSKHKPPFYARADFLTGGIGFSKLDSVDSGKAV